MSNDSGDKAEPTQNVPMTNGLPDEWWLTYSLNERVPLLFFDHDGNVDTVPAVWVEDNVFEIMETPLRINGVSLYDRVEARWKPGDLTPIFGCVKHKDGYSTIRADVREIDKRVKKHLEDLIIGRVAHYRLVGDILILTYYNDPSYLVEFLDQANISWEFADRNEPKP